MSIFSDFKGVGDGEKYIDPRVAFRTHFLLETGGSIAIDKTKKQRAPNCKVCQQSQDDVPLNLYGWYPPPNLDWVEQELARDVDPLMDRRHRYLQMSFTIINEVGQLPPTAAVPAAVPALVESSGPYTQKATRSADPAHQPTKPKQTIQGIANCNDDYGSNIIQLSDGDDPSDLDFGCTERRKLQNRALSGIARKKPRVDKSRRSQPEKESSVVSEDDDPIVVRRRKPQSGRLSKIEKSAKRDIRPWDEEEKTYVRDIIEAICEENRPESRTERRWIMAAERLRTKHSIFRTWTSVKNYWNREGRAASGYDERNVKQPDRMVTGIQDKEQRKTARMQKRKRLSGQTAEDADTDNEIQPLKRKRLASDGFSLDNEAFSAHRARK